MTVQDANQAYPRMIVTITREEEKKELEALLDALHVPICYQCRGRGTAPSETMDIFGLRGTTRLLTAGVMPKFMVRRAFDAMAQRLHFLQKGGGIAFTIPVTGLQSPVLHVLNDEARPSCKKN